MSWVTIKVKALGYINTLMKPAYFFVKTDMKDIIMLANSAFIQTPEDHEKLWQTASSFFIQRCFREMLKRQKRLLLLFPHVFASFSISKMKEVS